MSNNNTNDSGWNKNADSHISPFGYFIIAIMLLSIFYFIYMIVTQIEGNENVNPQEVASLNTCKREEAANIIKKQGRPLVAIEFAEIKSNGCKNGKRVTISEAQLQSAEAVNQ